ncbi:MAG: hypothetical protein IT175_06035 [Acidobacteria bacterium]|nr:hypothetical protein [Acidobacteriota bacterium]
MPVAKGYRSVRLRSHCKLNERQVRAAHVLYLQGMSLREIADLIWRRYGYASAVTCEKALGRLFRRLQLPVRPSGSRWRLIPESDYALLIERYRSGESFTSIARDYHEKWGVSHAQAEAAIERLYLRRLGNSRRSVREAKILTRAEALRRKYPAFCAANLERLVAHAKSRRQVARENWQAWGFPSLVACEAAIRRRLERERNPLTFSCGHLRDGNTYMYERVAHCRRCKAQYKRGLCGAGRAA